MSQGQPDADASLCATSTTIWGRPVDVRRFSKDVPGTLFCGVGFLVGGSLISAFSWLYTPACAVVQTYHEKCFIYNYSHF